jgi:hypothetical protein
MSDIFLIQKSTLTNTANAIRGHISDKSEISPADFPGKIDDVYTTGHDEGYAKGLSAGESGVTFTTRAVDPTTTTTTYNASDDNANGYSAFTVNAIPKQYVDTTNITKDSDDLLVSDNTISVPMGYYPNGASYQLSSLPEFDEVDDFELDVSGLDTELEVSYSVSEKVALPAGHHLLTYIEDTNFTPSNIKKGVNIFGLDGDYEGDGNIETWDGSDIAITETVATITFTINTRDCYAKEGMTWYEWCQDTNYNTTEAICAGDNEHEVYIGNEKVCTSDGPVAGGQTITSGGSYTTKTNS